jgi:hypothetical protein
MSVNYELDQRSFSIGKLSEQRRATLQYVAVMPLPPLISLVKSPTHQLEFWPSILLLLAIFSLNYKCRTIKRKERVLKLRT